MTRVIKMISGPNDFRCCILHHTSYICSIPDFSFKYAPNCSDSWRLRKDGSAETSLRCLKSWKGWPESTRMSSGKYATQGTEPGWSRNSHRTEEGKGSPSSLTELSRSWIYCRSRLKLRRRSTRSKTDWMRRSCEPTRSRSEESCYCMRLRNYEKREKGKDDCPFWLTNLEKRTGTEALAWKWP